MLTTSFWQWLKSFNSKNEIVLHINYSRCQKKSRSTHKRIEKAAFYQNLPDRQIPVPRFDQLSEYIILIEVGAPQRTEMGPGQWLIYVNDLNITCLTVSNTQMKPPFMNL